MGGGYGYGPGPSAPFSREELMTTSDDANKKGDTSWMTENMQEKYGRPGAAGGGGGMSEEEWKALTSSAGDGDSDGLMNMIDTALPGSDGSAGDAEKNDARVAAEAPPGGGGGGDGGGTMDGASQQAPLDSPPPLEQETIPAGANGAGSNMPPAPNPWAEWDRRRLPNGRIPPPPMYAQDGVQVFDPAIGETLNERDFARGSGPDGYGGTIGEVMRGAMKKNDNDPRFADSSDGDWDPFTNMESRTLAEDGGDESATGAGSAGGSDEKAIEEEGREASYERLLDHLAAGEDPAASQRRYLPGERHPKNSGDQGGGSPGEPQLDSGQQARPKREDLIDEIGTRVLGHTKESSSDAPETTEEQRVRAGDWAGGTSRDLYEMRNESDPGALEDRREIKDYQRFADSSASDWDPFDNVVDPNFRDETVSNENRNATASDEASNGRGDSNNDTKILKMIPLDDDGGNMQGGEGGGRSYKRLREQLSSDSSVLQMDPFMQGDEIKYFMSKVEEPTIARAPGASYGDRRSSAGARKNRRNDFITVAGPVIQEGKSVRPPNAAAASADAGEADSKADNSTAVAADDSKLPSGNVTATKE